MSSGRSRSGGSVDRHDVQAVEEVLAEAAGAHLVAQVAVGRGDQAHVDVQRLGAADAVEAPFLDHAQQLGLRGERHLADLVEEQRAAVGELEAARLAPAPRR